MEVVTIECECGDDVTTAIDKDQEAVVRCQECDRYYLLKYIDGELGVEQTEPIVISVVE